MLVNQSFAKNLEQLRRARGLSQSQLAEISGVPRSTLTYFESGEGNPTLNNLLKLSEALSVRLEELLSLPRPEVTLIRSADVPLQNKARGACQMFKLLPDRVPGMEIDRMELAPRARMAGHPHTQGTKEYFTCVKGLIKVYIAKQEYSLRAGDVLAFPGDQGHAYVNAGSSRAVGFSVVCFAD